MYFAFTDTHVHAHLLVSHRSTHLDHNPLNLGSDGFAINHGCCGPSFCCCHCALQRLEVWHPNLVTCHNVYVLLQTAYDLSGQDPVFDEKVMPPVAVANDDQ